MTHTLFEGFALNVFADEVGAVVDLIKIVDGSDIGVFKGSDDTGLALKPG